MTRLIDILIPLIYATILGFTGLLIFIQLYNRALLHLKHGTLKTIICYTAMAACPLSPFIYALFYHTALAYSDLWWWSRDSLWINLFDYSSNSP